jgi:predicted RNA-binding protein with PUA-like domain
LMPGYWLLKTEPGDYAYDDLVEEGRAVWDGVRNPVAQKHMRAVEPGDEAFVYHTGKERAVIGIARVESSAYADPAGDAELVVFEISPLERLQRPVTLAEIKASREFDDWELVRIPRLSVMPVPKRTWSSILKMSRR